MPLYLNSISLLHACPIPTAKYSLLSVIKFSCKYKETLKGHRSCKSIREASMRQKITQSTGMFASNERYREITSQEKVSNQTFSQEAKSLLISSAT